MAFRLCPWEGGLSACDMMSGGQTTCVSGRERERERETEKEKERERDGEREKKKEQTLSHSVRSTFSTGRRGLSSDEGRSEVPYAL